jgi:hypothetical protein
MAARTCGCRTDSTASATRWIPCSKLLSMSSGQGRLERSAIATPGCNLPSCRLTESAVADLRWLRSCRLPRMPQCRAVPRCHTGPTTEVATYTLGAGRLCRQSMLNGICNQAILKCELADRRWSGQREGPCTNGQSELCTGRALFMGDERYPTIQRHLLQVNVIWTRSHAIR